jgi:hypothetical protein
VTCHFQLNDLLTEIVVGELLWATPTKTLAEQMLSAGLETCVRSVDFKKLPLKRARGWRNFGNPVSRPGGGLLFQLRLKEMNS